MNPGGEAADSLVKMYLSGVEMMVRLSGSFLKNMLALTMALAKEHKKVSGKINLAKMLRETRDLHTFTMTPAQYKAFKKLAKKQGILFAAVTDKDDKGKLVDVILPSTELDRANQLFERILYNPNLGPNSPEPPQVEKEHWWQRFFPKREREQERNPEQEEHPQEEPAAEEPTREDPASEPPAPEEPSPEEPSPEEPSPENPAPEDPSRENPTREEAEHREEHGSPTEQPVVVVVDAEVISLPVPVPETIPQPPPGAETVLLPPPGPEKILLPSPGEEQILLPSPGPEPALLPPPQEPILLLPTVSELRTSGGPQPEPESGGASQKAAQGSEAPSKPALNGTSDKSPLPNKSGDTRTTSERPSVLKRLEGYRAQLEQKKESVPEKGKDAVKGGKGVREAAKPKIPVKGVKAAPGQAR